MAAERAPSADEVFNQPPPLADYNLFLSDTPLMEAVVGEGAAWSLDDLTAYGERLGAAETLEIGRIANREPPRLEAFDRYGRRLDRVDFHPAYHALMTLQVAQGIHATAWTDPRPGAHVHRAAGLYLSGQVDAGTSCPISMTHAASPLLARSSTDVRAWLPSLHSRIYDPAHRPVSEKAGALVGMGMTEKQGGSDLRGTVTRAEPLGAGPGAAYRIDGHKWFMSAPMCDAFLVLAQASGGLSCFFMPRWTPDGQLNALRFQRLKDKLGNRSNASSEVEFDGALAWLIGEEGRGVATIIEMVELTRLDNVVASAGVQRRALAEAIHHAQHRSAFGKRLGDHPLMTNVLADLALEVEAATTLAFRLARAFEANDDGSESLFRRIITPAAKFWVCKRGPSVAAEALEVLGGNGYVEDCALPRLYREAPLYGLWEGAGNIMCLDVLRAARRTPSCVDAVESEFAVARGADPALDRQMTDILARLRRPLDEADLRQVCRDLVIALQAALLIRHAPSFVIEAFLRSRLNGPTGAYGMLPAGCDHTAIIERAAPSSG